MTEYKVLTRTEYNKLIANIKRIEKETGKGIVVPVRIVGDKFIVKASRQPATTNYIQGRLFE